MSMNNEQLRPRMVNGRPDPIAWVQSEINDDGSITYRHKYDHEITFRHRQEPQPKITRNMPLPAPKKSAMPKKTVTRKAILDAIKEHQPLTRRSLRSQLGANGYDLDDKDTVKRLSNMLYRMIKIGLLKQVADDILSLPDCPESKFKSVQPVKKLAREAVYAAVKTHQPAEFPIIRQALLDDGYMVAMPSGRKRLSATLSFLRKEGRLAHDRALGLWSTTEPAEPTESANPTEPKPVAAATPEPAPIPKPELATHEPPKLPPALVQCHIIEGNFETADGETVSVYVASGGRVALTPIGSHAVSFGSLDELREFVARVHRLRSFLDDPQ